MAYNNPLHPPVHAANQSAFTSIGTAVQGGHTHSSFGSRSRRLLPQVLYEPSSKWKAATGRTCYLHQPVVYDYIGCKNQGIPMRELSSREIRTLSAILQDANDPVFVGTGLRRITLRILWPGYGHVEWTRSIKVHTCDGPITRSQLGAAIARNFARFVEKTQYETTESAEWHLGPSGIRYEHLVLISLWNTFEDSWQADVAVDMS